MIEECNIKNAISKGGQKTVYLTGKRKFLKEN